VAEEVATAERAVHPLVFADDAFRGCGRGLSNRLRRLETSRVSFFGSTWQRRAASFLMTAPVRRCQNGSPGVRAHASSHPRRVFNVGRAPPPLPRETGAGGTEMHYFILSM